MLRTACAILAGFLAITLSPHRAAGQAQSCDLKDTPTSRGQIMFGGTPQEMTFIGGGAILICPNGISIRSDSAVAVPINNAVDFIGNVVYSDSAKTLTANYVQYLGGGVRQVVARENVVLTDKKNGSTLRAPFLNYMMKNDTRPEDYISLPTGRPIATMIRPSAADSTRMDTTVMISEVMEIFGETRFVGRGRVEITRSGVKAFANTAEFTEDSKRMRLLGEARVESEDYTLHADSIFAETTESDEFREVLAYGNARLVSQEMRSEAPRIRVYFTEGEVSRLVAVTDTALKPRVQAHATSTDFRLDADSIDAIAPSQKVETVTAVGNAFGIRLTKDTTAAQQPELLQHDFVRGDTILAHFTDAPPDTMPADTAGPNRVLKHLDVRASTGLASALYRAADPEDPAAGLTVNYLRAKRIQVALEGGEVKSVEADRDVHGVYLRPLRTTPGGAATQPPRRPGG